LSKPQTPKPLQNCNIETSEPPNLKTSKPQIKPQNLKTQNSKLKTSGKCQNLNLRPQMKCG
jgi:hypothetical protein